MRVVETVTTREPEWDDEDRAMIDALYDWRADLHSCGRPRSECLEDPDKPDPQYQVFVENCRGMKAIQQWRHAREESDEAERKAGRDPDAHRLLTILPLAECPPEVQQQVRATQKRRRGHPSP